MVGRLNDGFSGDACQAAAMEGEAAALPATWASTSAGGGVMAHENGGGWGEPAATRALMAVARRASTASVTTRGAVNARRSPPVRIGRRRLAGMNGRRRNQRVE